MGLMQRRQPAPAWERTGWFAELDEDAPADCGWRGVLQEEGMVAAFDGPWFQTREDCEDWLRKSVIGQGMLDVRR